MLRRFAGWIAHAYCSTITIRLLTTEKHWSHASISVNNHRYYLALFTGVPVIVASARVIVPLNRPLARTIEHNVLAVVLLATSQTSKIAH